MIILKGFLNNSELVYEAHIFYVLDTQKEVRRASGLPT